MIRPNDWLSIKNTTIFQYLFQNVHPDPSSGCGPYIPNESESSNEIETETDFVKFGGEGNHDTIGMVSIDASGNVASGTSTNGASFKISGFVLIQIKSLIKIQKSCPTKLTLNSCSSVKISGFVSWWSNFSETDVCEMRRPNIVSRTNVAF